MFYTKSSEGSYKFKQDGYKHEFNHKNLVYFEDGMLAEKQEVELTEYQIESDAELAILYKEYTEWCEQHNQEPNQHLKAILANNSIQWWKHQKLIELNDITDKYEDNLNRDMYFISSLNFKANGDRRTANNLANLISMFEIMGEETIPYRDYDDVDHNLNKAQLQTLLAEHITNGNSIYTQKWEKKDQINSSETLEDLNAVSLEFTMQDFSQVPYTDKIKKLYENCDTPHKNGLSKFLKY